MPVTFTDGVIPEDAKDDDVEAAIPEGAKDDDVEAGTSTFTSSSNGIGILLLDLQNEFAKEGGKLYESVYELTKKTGMLQKIPGVVSAARQMGATIIYAPVVLSADKSFDLSDDNHSYYAMTGLFTKGTKNCEIIDELKPNKGDLILTGRTNFCAFEGTELDSIISNKGISRLFIMGYLTNICVEETAREASERFPDLEINILSDGCAAKTEQDQNNALLTTLPLYGNVIMCSEAIKSIVTGHLKSKDSTKLPENLSTRPRILALHGARSNNAVTKLQLENLNISEEVYDIIYMRGLIEVEDADPDLEGLIHGPFYSWIDKENCGSSLVAAVASVLNAVTYYGPFDGIYGFSQGGLVAALAAGINNDMNLRDAIIDYGSKNKTTRRRASSMIGNRSFSNGYRASSVLGKSGPKSARYSIYRKSTISNNKLSLRASMFGSTSMKSGDFGAPPFRFVLLACSASPSNLVTLSQYPGLEVLGSIGSIQVPSFHIVGVEDMFKTQSEEVAVLFRNRTIAYLNSGHIIGRDERSNTDLTSSLKSFLSTRGNIPTTLLTGKFVRMSEVSSVALNANSQVANVKLDHYKLPEGLYKNEGGSTIINCLKAQPPLKPFLYVARGTDSSKTTTYGDVVEFIHGAGNLRKIGVTRGEVVAYGAPPGGGAAAALAFLSISAQTAAAPIAPGTTEPDTLDTLDQFKAKHLILFDGVDCPGVESAFKKFSEDGNAKLHRATIIGDDRPGLFEYTNGSQFSTDLKLENSENGVCLLLRTSGTTARPKGVPLSQGSIVTNGQILASSMGLTKDDVCYSVMPLFHIGGISASILCTLTSGGSVSCDGEGFDPERMVDALHLSSPQPTWYSSVPTIHNATVTFLKNTASSSPKHNAYGIKSDGTWPKGKGHSLRMIRSGAAALLGPDGEALTAAYGGVPIYPTYSMSEQMPISQPPAGKIDTLTDKPGSVGVPVAASTAIVNRSNLRPQAYGVKGEISISGPTVLKKYLENPDADRKNFFLLTLPGVKGAHLDPKVQIEKEIYFLTGDVGLIDKDGFLSLKGRAKELIKKGGEQISPFEVEEKLVDHPMIETAICFSVPSPLYGEEVGCALVLSSTLSRKPEDKKIITEMRMWMKGKQFAPMKWPTKWIICEDSQLLKTKTKKYIRVGLSTHFGLDPEQEGQKEKEPIKARIDFRTLSGLRFLLACYVMFMHLGSNKSWGAFSNLRGWPWHVHCFFTLGGYSMASPMNPIIKKKFSYFLARIGGMYPMYAIALVFCLANLLVVCRPSTFRTEFHWDSQPHDLQDENGELSPLFCEGTVATPNSYWGSLILTVLTYLFGFAVTPMWPISWWLGYYLWFSSMYYQCLAFFPATYNYLYNKTRKKVGTLLRLIIFLMVFNVAILMVGWFIFKDYDGYNHYDENTGQKLKSDDYKKAGTKNAFVLSFYLFGPFWALYFVIGMCVAFLYDAYHPAERHNAWIWGWIADGITLIMLGISVAIVAQGRVSVGEFTEPGEFYMRPSEADQYTDTSFINRLWDNISGRLTCPLTTLWIFSLSTGRGVTAALLRTSFWSQTLAPNAYNCFLFHQIVGQWYFAATRNGHWWNWWRYRKTLYWFSPYPCPVEWYEYFYLVILVVGFSNVMNTVEPLVGDTLLYIKAVLSGKKGESIEEDTTEAIFDIIEGMTGIEPQLDWSLEECGLASVGVPVIVGLLNKRFSKKNHAVQIAAADLISAKTIAEMVDVVDGAKEKAAEQGV